MEDFDDIRPYSEAEAKERFLQIADNESFVSAMRQIIPEYSPERLKQDCPKFNSIYDFQKATSGRFIDKFIQMSTAGVTRLGLDHIQRNQSYVYIGNHRDITFDAALLSDYFFRNDINTVKIAIGDNLISSDILCEVARLNKMVLVKRSVSMRDKITNYRHLSSYIHQVLFNEHESVWIAQRDGRTKDGLDITKQGLVKMLAMDDTVNPLEMLKKINLTPFTVSYEYEPCDQLKARELALSEAGPYHKQPGEDFNSVMRGIFDFKGRIQIVIGTPIVDEIDTIDPQLNQNDRIYEVCKMVDRQIYSNYRLFPNNFIAFDLIDGNDRFIDRYSAEEKEKFIDYLNKRAVIEDVPAEKMMHYLLRIYANPVATCLNVKYNM